MELKPKKVWKVGWLGDPGSLSSWLCNRTDQTAEKGGEAVTFMGDILGYDSFGGDLFGVNRDSGQNCIVCGRSVYHHSEEQNNECFAKYAKELRESRLQYYRRKYPVL